MNDLQGDTLKGYYQEGVSPQSVNRVLVGNSTGGQIIYILSAIGRRDGKPCGLEYSGNDRESPRDPRGIKTASAWHPGRKENWGSAGVGPWEQWRMAGGWVGFTGQAESRKRLFVGKSKVLGSTGLGLHLPQTQFHRHKARYQ